VLPQTIPVCRSHQPFCFHILARSLSSPKKSTPLESSKSRLFSQNTRRGGGRENRVFGINNIQTLFSDSVCKSVTPAALRSFSAPRCLPGDPIYSLLFQPLRQLRVLCASALSSRLPFLSRLPAAVGLCFHNDTNCFSRLPAGPLAGNSFVFTTIRIARGVPPPAAIPLATRHSPLLPWTP